MFGETRLAHPVRCLSQLNLYRRGNPAHVGAAPRTPPSYKVGCHLNIPLNALPVIRPATRRPMRPPTFRFWTALMSLDTASSLYIQDLRLMGASYLAER